MHFLHAPSNSVNPSAVQDPFEIVLSGRRVEKVNPAVDIHVLPSITLSDHETPISAKKAVVVATDGPSALEILDRNLLAGAPSKESDGVGTCCLYFRYRFFYCN